VLHKLGDFRNVVVFLNSSLNFGWGIGMMMASLKKKQIFQESKRTQI